MKSGIAIVAASTTDNTFLIRFLSFFLTSPSHLSDRFINSFYYFLNKLPFQHLGKKIAPFLKNSLFQLFLTMAHLFVSAFGSLFIFYLILTLILRLGKLFCRNYIIFLDFSRFLCDIFVTILFIFYQHYRFNRSGCGNREETVYYFLRYFLCFYILFLYR